jgi:hypothetical protein
MGNRGEKIMDSSISYRHAEVHYSELRDRADLHRLAARARETSRDRRPSRLTNVRIPRPGAAVLGLLSGTARTPRRA